jgi:hypothetical protein
MYGVYPFSALPQHEIVVAKDFQQFATGADLKNYSPLILFC